MTALVGAVVLWFVVEPVVGLVYITIVTLFQLIDRRVWAPLTVGSSDADVSAREWRRYCFLSFLTAATYSLLPLLLWTTGHGGLQVFAIMWVMGSLLHVTLTMFHERRTYIVAAFAHGGIMFLMPAFSLATGMFADRLTGAIVAFGTLLYSGHLLATFRSSEQARDETDKSRVEAQERQVIAEAASRSKSDFLANMSHEIRTPLNGIIGMAEVLQSEDLSDEAREKATIIRESGDVLLQLLNDILDVSKIEAGRLELEERAFDLNEVARKTANLHSLKAREKGLDFDVIVDDGLCVHRLGDEHRLMQILHNLVSNALKFTDEGAVTVRFAALDGQPDRLALFVNDTGIGMTPEQLSRVYGSFAQADTSTSRRFGGTGLGLSIVEGLVTAMSGTISATSQPGAGSSFVAELTLPVSDEEHLDAPDTNDTPLPLAGLENLRLLLADDNHVNRIVLQSLLMPTGAAMVQAENGAEAVRCATSATFDAVLMDISMPVMDGKEAMQILKEQLGTDCPPIIAVSAHAMSHQVEAYLADGFDGYLTKPVNSTALIAELQRLAVPAEAPKSEASN